MKFFIENRLSILPKSNAPEDRAKRPSACFSEGCPMFSPPRHRPSSGPGRQASTSPGCACRASSIVQRTQERAGSLSMCRCQMRWGSRRRPGCAWASTVSGTSSDKALALRQGSVMTRFCRMAMKKDPIQKGDQKKVSLVESGIVAGTGTPSAGLSVSGCTVIWARGARSSASASSSGAESSASSGWPPVDPARLS